MSVRERAGAVSGVEPDPVTLQSAAGVFGLLASTVRLHIVWVLGQGECDVGTLAELVGGTLQSVSQHLAKLKLAGLVTSRREGRRQVYLVQDPALVAVVRQVLEPPERAERGRGVGA